MGRQALRFALAIAVCWVSSSVALAQPTQKVARVGVLASGSLQLNGEPTTLEELKAELSRLRSEKGEVWYWREQPTGEPPPIALQVLQLVTEAQLPISFSSKADFSDVLDLRTGESRPRTEH
jgi:hypothetical protein